MSARKRTNMSDVIEAYLKNFLENSEQLEIRRSDIAEQFDCVPSQINYVINTRFTQEHGYVVESKRGGGGYIRILKIELDNEVDQIDQMIKLVGKEISEKDANNIISTLHERDIVSEREARMMLAVLSKSFLADLTNQEQMVRAILFKRMLEELRYIY